MADSGYSAPDTEPKKGAKPTDVAVARKRLHTAIEATNQNRFYQVDDQRFAAGSPDNKFQWPERLVAARENDPNGPRPCLTINKLPQHINQITNEQRQNRPSIKVSPVDDKGDKEVAEVLTGIIRHIEYQSDADVAYATAGENQVTHGEGYVRVLTDYLDERSFEQDIVIAQVKNSFSAYMDPLGLMKDATGRYCEWAFVVEDCAKDEFERKYPDAEPVNWDLVGTGDEWLAWFPDSNTVRVAEYFCYVHETKRLFRYANGATQIEGEPLPEGVMAVEKPIQERNTKVRSVMWQKMNGCAVIEERKWAGRHLPIVRFVGNEWYIEGKLHTAGIVRNAKDAQRMFNYWKSTETETLALAPKSPFVGPAEAFEGFEDDWQQANVKSFPFLKYNQWSEGRDEKNDRPERQQPPMPPIGIVNAALGAADDIKSATGQYDPSLGNNPQAKSGVALAREQRKTDIGTFHYLDNQARAVRQLGRVLVDLVPKIYDTRRVARILGEDGSTDYATLDPDLPQPMIEQPNEEGAIEKIYNPTIGRYDVTVSVGPGYTSKRQEAAEFMAQVLQGNKELMAVMGDLYFEMLDVPGADAISERLKKTLPPGLAEPEEGEDQGPMVQTPQGPVPVEAAGQMLAQMGQQIQEMQEQLQKADVIGKEAEAAKVQVSAEKERDAAAAKQRELDIEEERLSVERYNAETNRMKAENDALIRAAAEAQKAKTAAEDRDERGEERGEAREEKQRERRESVNVIDSSVAGPLSEVAQSTKAVAEAVAQQSAAIGELAKATRAPRRQRMTVDGEVMESMSEVVPETETVQ